VVCGFRVSHSPFLSTTAPVNAPRLWPRSSDSSSSCGIAPQLITARPSQAEETAAHEQHRPPTALQTQHVNAASTNHALLASVNHGRLAIAATAKPAEFNGKGVVAAKQAGAPYKAAENHTAAPSAASKAVPGYENSTPHPESATRPAPVAHAQPAPRPETAPRPEAHPENATHPEKKGEGQPPQ
jgi:hypothetical protein